MFRLKKLTGLEFQLRLECLVFDSYTFLLLSGQWLFLELPEWLSFPSFSFFKSESQLPYLCEQCTLLSSSSCDLWKVLKALKPHGFWFECKSQFCAHTWPQLAPSFGIFSPTAKWAVHKLSGQRTPAQFYQWFIGSSKSGAKYTWFVFGDLGCFKRLQLIDLEYFP